MSRVCRVVALALLAAPVVLPLQAGSAGSKLSRDDRRWLEGVGPLITAEEARLFEQIDARDREPFRQIFWARRDPDPATPANERQVDFEARRNLADLQLRQAGLRGSATDMGRVFLLLGPPARVSHGRIGSSGAPVGPIECDVCNVELESSLIMMVGPTAGMEQATFVTWSYSPEPLLGIPRGLTVEFRSQFGLGHRLVRSEDVDRALDRARRLCICDGTRGYELDEVGRLVPKAASARGDDRLARALLSPREWAEASSQIAIEATPAFFRTPGEATYVPVLFEVEPDSLSWSDEVAEVTVSGRVDVAEGEPPARLRLRVALTRDPDGRVRFDLPFALSPGRRELRLAVQDDVSGAVGVRVVDLTIPDFHSGAPTMSSVIAYADAREVDGTPGTAGHAFQFGRVRFAPRQEFRRNEKLGLLFYVYGLEALPDASPVVRYAFFRDGELCGQTAEKLLPVSGTQAIGNTTIPLASLAPGRYALTVTVTDRRSETMLARSVTFELKEAAS